MMSTRACYQFIDEDENITVYKHWDGYPSGAKEAIEAAIPYAWPFPRFEAGDFSAAFVAANRRRPTDKWKNWQTGKKEPIPRDMIGGNVYLLPNDAGKGAWKNHLDLDYLYVVAFDGDSLEIEAHRVCHDDRRDCWHDEIIYSGPLAGLEKSEEGVRYGDYRA